MDELAPIRFFTNVFILHDLRRCFDQHIKPLHVDTENFKQKSKFDPLYDNKYDPFDICSITFLLPYFAHHSCRNRFDSGTIKVILWKLFHFRVGSYYSESLVEYESRWVKGVYCMTKNYITGLYDLEIKVAIQYQPKIMSMFCIILIFMTAILHLHLIMLIFVGKTMH